MTAEEKAKELIQKFRISAGSYKDEEGTTINEYLVAKHVAKKAALICVQEVINSFDDCSCVAILPGTLGLKEWKQVKECLNQISQ